MNISVYFQNVNGLRTKTKQFYNSVLGTNYDIICLNETNLNESILNTELFTHNYVLYRKDRNLAQFPDKVDGGGCLIAIKKNFVSYRIAKWECYSEEIWVCINFGLTNLYLNVPYIYPGAKPSDYENYFDNINYIMNQNKTNSSFLIIGDFNLPFIKWKLKPNNLIKPCLCDNRSAQALTECINFTGLNQFNYIHNVNNTILDLVLSNISFSSIKCSESIDVLVKTDRHHPALEIDLNIKTITLLKDHKFKIRNFRKSNFDNIRQDLSVIKWAELLQDLNTEQSVSKFYEILDLIIQTHVPLVSHCINSYPSWYTNKTINLIKIKNRYRMLFKKNNDVEYYQMFSKIRSKLKQITKIDHINYIKSIENSIHKNPKKFWSYSKSLKRTNTVPANVHFDNISASNAKDISDLFADFFSSVYNNPNISQSNIHPSIINTTPTFDICVEDIFNELRSLNSNKGCGPDLIPPLFLIESADQLCKPLEIIFNKSLSEGVFPSVWKNASITPIHKAGDNSDIKNYRPISILNCFSKIFERIIHNKLFERLRNKITVNQHGFFKQRSTLTNLLDFSEYVYASCDLNYGVDVIYTDFQKAFDKVNHDILIKKLRRSGVDELMLKWISSYLKNRTQYVIINDMKSHTISPSSGVPQGSILGPLLFILFINDIVEGLECPVLLFADDLKIFLSIKSISDCQRLQNDLNRLHDWCVINDMNLNIDKCFVLKIKPRVSSIFNYSINNIDLVSKDQVKDLGVIVDNKFKFNIHIQYITNKSLKILGLMMRTCSDFKNISSFISMFNGLIRSNLESVTTIWNPVYGCHKLTIERVQKKFTRFLYYKSGIPYEQYNSRLKRYGLVSLESRRIIFDELALYKISNRLIETKLTNLIRHRARLTYNMRFSVCFDLHTYKSNFRTHSPLVRLQTNHNNIFNNFDLSMFSFHVFKKQITNFFLNKDTV